MYRMDFQTLIAGTVTFPEKLWSGVKWEFFPNVGARHKTVNNLLGELSDLPKSDRSLALLRPNLITNIGYLMPERSHKGWSFPIDADIEKPMDDMIAAIENYGVPFMSELVNEDGFCKTLATGQFTIANYDRDLPALYFIRGENTLATECVCRGIKARINRHDPEAAQYRKFAAKLQALIAERIKRF